MEVWIILAAVVGLVVGLLIGWLFASQRGATDRTRAADATKRLEANEAERRDLAKETADARAARERAEATLEAVRQDVDDERQRRVEVETERTQAIELHRTAHARAEQLAAKLDATTVDLQAERERFAKSQTELKDAFATLSQSALSRNREEFMSLAKTRFDALQAEAAGDLGKRQEAIEAQVKPLREALDQYQQRLDKVEESRKQAYVNVHERLAEIVQTHTRLDRETSKLATALSRPGTRGRWGELTLQRLLELAGLNSGTDYEEQHHLAADGDGGSLRPDLVVHLPGDRVIVIDSKYAADDFLKAAESTDEAERKKHLAAHAATVKRHAQTLSQKGYTSRFARAPDYVVMFLPSEALIYAAATADPSLLEQAMRDKVIIATPTTLVALLKTIAAGWREAEVEANIEEVKKAGGEMLERVATFAEHLGSVGTSLDSSVQHFNRAIGSLDRMLLPACRRMKELSIESKKELPDAKRLDAATRKVPEVVTDGAD
jgi:DNA recombination protein RmuC